MTCEAVAASVHAVLHPALQEQVLIARLFLARASVRSHIFLSFSDTVSMPIEPRVGDGVSVAVTAWAAASG